MAYNDVYIGRQIGNYRILKEIARGGSGRVYLAQHRFLQERSVVIKLLYQVYLGSQQDQDFFMREAQFMEKLKHPYILPVLDVGIDDDQPYLITEYAPLGSLRDRLQRRQGQHLLLNEALTILSQMGQALSHAHQQQIIHRDLKPENVLFGAQGQVLLADFGISTVLATSSVKQTEAIGTPAYMAPEQFRGSVSKESDQYALACIAYELFTGQRPFTATDFVAIGFMHVTEPPLAPRQLNPGLPVYIEQAILKAMAKERSERYPDIRAFVDALHSTPSLVRVLPQKDVAIPTMQENNAPASKEQKKKERQRTASAPISQEQEAGPQKLVITSPQWKDSASFLKITKGRRWLAGLGYVPPLFLLDWLVFPLAGRRNRFNRFHFMQSLMVWLLLCIGTMLVLILAQIHSYDSYFTPISYAVAAYVLISVLFWLIGMVAAFRGKYGKLPLIGIFAQRFANKRPM